MTDQWTDQLSAYLDGELGAEDTARLEAHLTTCAECREVLADLRRITSSAGGYLGAPPSRDLWPAIQTEIDRSRVVPLSRRIGPARFGLRELLAAGLVMAMAGAGGAWYLARRADRGPAPVVAATPAAESDFLSAAYDSAAAELSETVRANRGRLDTATVRVLEQSIRTIDQAVAEARAAIQRDSANAYLNEQIAANLKRKLNLLKAATRAIHSET